jgi:hemerythrin superfamily protein
MHSIMKAYIKSMPVISFNQTYLLQNPFSLNKLISFNVIINTINMHNKKTNKETPHHNPFHYTHKHKET